MKVSRKFASKSFGAARQQQRGLSILGALFALVIGALLTIVTVNAFQDSQRKTRVSAALQDIQTMAADVQKNFGSANQYGVISTAAAIQTGIVPARLRVAGTNTANNSYNGAITFVPDTITVANDATLMSFANITSEDCSDIVFGAEQLARRVVVAGVTVKPNDGVMDAVATGGACDSAGRVTIAFAIGRKG